MKLGIMASVAFGITLFFFLVFPLTASSEQRVISKDGSISVTYRVSESYKIAIVIDTKNKKRAYFLSEEADAEDIEVVFNDLNLDGAQDLIIKFADETGYSPLILINDNYLSFVNALRDIKELVYVSTELDIDDEGKVAQRRDYELKDINGDGVSELVFYNVFLGENGYRYVAFRFDAKDAKYLIYGKGDIVERQE